MGFLSILGECRCVWGLLGVFKCVGGVVDAFGCFWGVFCGDMRFGYF